MFVRVSPSKITLLRLSANPILVASMHVRATVAKALLTLSWRTGLEVITVPITSRTTIPEPDLKVERSKAVSKLIFVSPCGGGFQASSEPTCVSFIRLIPSISCTYWRMEFKMSLPDLIVLSWTRLFLLFHRIHKEQLKSRIWNNDPC